MIIDAVFLATFFNGFIILGLVSAIFFLSWQFVYDFLHSLNIVLCLKNSEKNQKKNRKKFRESSEKNSEKNSEKKSEKN